MTGEYNDALTAADELYHATTELIESEESNLHVIGVVAETYLSARGQPDLAKTEKDVRVAIEAADGLAGWLQDMVEVQSEPPSAEQGKSLLGVLGAWLQYEHVRSAPADAKRKN
jgi:hypothetical protein